VFIIFFSETLNAQEFKKISLTKVEKQIPGKEMVEEQTDKIILYEDVDEFYVQKRSTKGGSYYEITAPGLMQSFDKGNPDLPVISRLIDIPYDAEVSVRILQYDEEIVHFNEYHLINKIIPAQPSVSKSDDIKKIPFYKNKQLYRTNRFYQKELVQFTDKGYLRNKHLGHIAISPFQYNPVSNTLKVLRNIKIEVSFIQNSAKSKNDQAKLHSSYFNNLDLSTVNEVPETESEKALITNPVKYVIVSDPMFKETLQPFIEWKIQKGYKVVDVYTDNPNVGSTTASIKSFLQEMYDNPADGVSPTFILFVGDVAQIPPFDGETGSHVTDLYFCDYTDDNLPDVFYGRFSATTVAELQPQIDKTLMVEKYQIPNPSYLDNVVLVAGVDSDFAPTHGNGAINYMNTNYSNQANGINSYYYLYQDDSGVMSSDDPGASASIRDSINQGVSFSNYTAHCNYNGWGDPSFLNSDIENMTNENMYPFMIGNCCLSSKFEENSFGENIVRAENKGAVGYIGASNNTYWDEDYWWAVGKTDVITVDPTYEDSELGVYDRFFHLNGEPVEDWYVTQGQVLVAGNLAVEASTSARKKYYWEIYHLMGDPSLSPFVKVPEVLTASYNDTVTIGTNSFTVNTENNAYVALSLDGVLLDAQRTGPTGQVTLTYNTLDNVGILDLVITKQNRQPVIEQVEIIPSDNPHVAFDYYKVHDITGNGNRLIDYGEEITIDMQVKNVSDTYDAFNVTSKLISSDSSVVIIDSVETYGDILYLDSSLANGAYIVQFDGRLEDQKMITFDLLLQGNDAEDSLYEWNSKVNMVVHAPVIEISDLLIDDSGGNDDQFFDPGETVSLELVVENKGHSDIENVTVHAGLLTDISSLSLIDTVAYNRSIMANSSDTVSFRAFLHQNEKPGNVFNISFKVKDETYNYYNDTVVKEIAVGTIPNYKINSVDTVWVGTRALFYDSGGKEFGYSDNEDHTIIFYPENPRGKLTLDFAAFDVESDTQNGGCYDYLSLYDADNLTSENLVDDYCNLNKPSAFTASNEKGAIAFRFSSDVSVTHAGWEAMIKNTGYLVKFIVKNTSGELLQDAVVEFETDKKYTNVDGEATFNYIPQGENLPFTIRKSGYSNRVDSVTIANDSIVAVTLEEGMASVDVTFKVLSNSNSVDDAAVVFDNDTLYTDLNGTAVFNDVPEGDNKIYQIIKEHYNTVIDTVNVAVDDITEQVELAQKIYRITFAVSDGVDPIESASITYNDDKEYTDKNGEFVFDLTYASDQEFVIKKDGFQDSDTIINIDSEKTIVVVLKSTVGFGSISGHELKIYPNPTRGELTIEMDIAQNVSYALKIYDVLGKLIYADDLQGSQHIQKQIDLSTHPKGLYFLNIRSSAGENISKRILIQ